MYETAIWITNKTKVYINPIWGFLADALLWCDFQYNEFISGIKTLNLNKIKEKYNTPTPKTELLIHLVSLLYSALLCAGLHIMEASVFHLIVLMFMLTAQKQLVSKLHMRNHGSMLYHNGLRLAAFCGLNTKTTNSLTKI